MKAVLKILGLLLIVLILVGAGGYFWASSASDRKLAQVYEVHAVDFPIPFPLSDGEIAELGIAPEEAERVATELAIERGRHLVDARYGCTECHGADFGGGVMVDAFPLGTLLGSNLTLGAGSRTLTYTAADWDRIVRHGVLPDGRPSAMPAQDFQRMSDQELSDIVAFIRSHPPVNAEVPPPVLGPLGKVLLATGQLPLSVDVIGSHSSAHAVYPPAPAVNVEFGGHLAATCSGCHGSSFAGGPIVGGDPSWAPASNLTPDPTGLASWSLDDFITAMREGVRPDGTNLQSPMAEVLPYARNMTEVELEAIWLYLQSLPPVPTES